ncbi:Uncharacterised protein [Klebsiella pneumoniae]|nr:Uncharacterised protein [Klebsiella pneumoniae]DAL61782.1 MAG TPA_asm: hypothetical protein [Caudoviricetes sp.]
MTIVKTHTGTVITKDGPQVKNCTRQSGCGSSAKTSFTTKKPDAVTLQKIRAADCCSTPSSLSR